MKTARIGAVDIPLRGGIDLETTLEWLGGETILRTIGGTGIKQATWSKLRITFSGTGWIPPGLAGIDTTQQQTVASAVPCALTADGSRQATLPTARRSDTGYEPWAWAIMPDGSVQDTALALVGNVGTADAVADALSYQILYYPQITAWLSRPTESGERTTASYRWELIAEQV